MTTDEATAAVGKAIGNRVLGILESAVAAFDRRTECMRDIQAMKDRTEVERMAQIQKAIADLPVMLAKMNRAAGE